MPPVEADPDSDDQEELPSLFEDLMDQTVGPMQLELPDPSDAAHVLTWHVGVPDADGVCELDHVTHPVDVIEELLDEGQADDVLDVLDPQPWSTTLAVAARLRRHFALPESVTGLWTHLVEQIDLYGEAIDADFFDRGHDLLDWFRGRRPWPQLARLIARLPPESRYMAAVLDDEELARERIAAAGPEDRTKSRTRPPLVGESLDRIYARATVSALRRIEFAVYAAQSGGKSKGKPPPPLPGPETAEDRVREHMADTEIEEIFDAVDPSWRSDRAAIPAGYTETSSGLVVPTH